MPDVLLAARLGQGDHEQPEDDEDDNACRGHMTPCRTVSKDSGRPDGASVPLCTHPWSRHMPCSPRRLLRRGVSG